jgi:hypothetical protein
LEASPSSSTGAKPRADGAEGVEALAARPLAVAVLEVARADVVGGEIAGDHVERPRRREAPPARADHDRELSLGVDVRRLRREHDLVAVADERGRKLGEEERLRG